MTSKKKVFGSRLSLELLVYLLILLITKLLSFNFSSGVYPQEG